MKLALGTVQFGLAYGAFNSTGQISSEDVQEILDHAAESGVNTLDTARAYGNSEEVLASTAEGRFRIVTKCPPLKVPLDLADAFYQSLKTLKQPIEGYLLHNAKDLLGPDADAIWANLDRLRQSGLVKKIGVSAYSQDEVCRVAERFDISLVQLPANILTPWYNSSKIPEHIEVHVRSAFLQGFLLSSPETLSKRFAPWVDTLKLFRSQAHEAGLTPLQASLAPLIASSAIDRVVVGVDTLAQLSDILDASRATDKGLHLGPFPHVTPALTDPRTWSIETHHG